MNKSTVSLVNMHCALAKKCTTIETCNRAGIGRKMSVPANAAFSPVNHNTPRLSLQVKIISTCSVVTSLKSRKRRTQHWCLSEKKKKKKKARTREQQQKQQRGSSHRIPSESTRWNKGLKHRHRCTFST